MKNRERKDRYKAKLLQVLAKHVGKSRSIGMMRLYEEVFGRPCRDKINDTRELRRLITELRREGVPVCSDTQMEGGGYYLASAGSEIESYCRRLRNRALKILRMEAIIRNMTLPDLLGQLSLNMGAGNGKNRNDS